MQTTNHVNGTSLPASDQRTCDTSNTSKRTCCAQKIMFLVQSRSKRTTDKSVIDYTLTVTCHVGGKLLPPSEKVPCSQTKPDVKETTLYIWIAKQHLHPPIQSQRFEPMLEVILTQNCSSVAAIINTSNIVSPPSTRVSHTDNL